VDLSPLGGDDRGRMTSGVGQAVELAAVVTVTDPDHLAIGEAGGRREAHRVGCV